MEGIENITVENLGLREEYCNIFRIHNITSPEKIVEYIELYRILSRSELKRRINMLLPDNEISSLKLKAKLSLSKELENLCNRYEVLLIQEGVSKMSIILDMFNTHNLDGLELSLSRFTIEYKYVTPYNFKELCGVTQSNYDPIILFKRYFIEALDLHASDMHFTVEHKTIEPSYKITYRVDNRIVPSELDIQLDTNLNRDILYKIVSQKTNSNVNDINVTGIATLVSDPLGDGRFSIRLAANKCYDGYRYVCRIQKPDTVSLRIEELGFDLGVQQELGIISRKLHGVTFITGAIRTGKNTTAFALANSMIDKPITMADYSSPIETLMAFPQMDYMGSVERLVDLVKLAKKQDLNVAFINEIPDKSVAFAVRDLVNSSVHVITTFHINRLWHLPHKLSEYYGESFKDVLTQVNGVCNQKMFVKQCKNCTRQILVSSIRDIAVRELLQKYGIESVFENTGCSQCNEGSLKGAVQPYAECLLFTDKIRRDLLKYDKPYQMEEYLYNLMHERKTALEYKVCDAIRKGELHYNSLYQLL